MKKSDFKKLIKEEIQKILNEESYDTLRDLRAAGVNPNNRAEVEKYLGRELDDSEYNELIGKGDYPTIVGRRNGQPIYSDGGIGRPKSKSSFRRRY
jgi:hypothetical protein